MAWGFVQRTDLENVFGKRNIEAWANIDNISETDVDYNLAISARIIYFCELGEETLFSRLWEKRYSEYLEEDPATALATIPKLIRHAATLLAGVALFDSRSVTYAADSNAINITTYRQQAEVLIENLNNGAQKLGWQGWQTTRRLVPDVV